jgi:hypothetical protein
MEYIFGKLIFLLSVTAVSPQGFTPMESIISPTGSGNGIHSVVNSNPSPNARPNGAGGAPNNPAMETVQNPNRFAMAPFLGRQGRPGTDFTRPSNTHNPDPNTLINMREKPRPPIRMVKMPHLCPTMTWSTDSMVVLPMPVSRMKTAVGTLPIRHGIVTQQGRKRLPFSMEQMMIMKMRNQIMSHPNMLNGALSAFITMNGAIPQQKTNMMSINGQNLMNGMGAVPQAEPNMMGGMTSINGQNMVNGMGAVPQPEPNMMGGMTSINGQNMVNGMGAVPQPEPNMMGGMPSINGQNMVNGMGTIPNSMSRTNIMLQPSTNMMNNVVPIPEPNMVNFEGAMSSSATNMMGNMGPSSTMSMSQSSIPSPHGKQNLIWMSPSVNMMVAMSYPATSNGPKRVQRLTIY